MELTEDLTAKTAYMDSYIHQFITNLVDYSPKLISAFLVLFVGLYLIKFVLKFVNRIFTRRNVDPTLSRFITDTITWVLRILLFVSFIDKLGIATSSFVAILGAAGLAISLSLQGSLSNFAGGMLIILFKPFKVGDEIEAQGVSGTVVEIQVFVTKLVTGNNQAIFVPNGTLSNGTIINFSMQGKRRCNLLFSVPYNANLKEVKEVIMQVMENNPRVLKDPAPVVAVVELTDTAIKLSLKAWADNSEFGDMTSEILEESNLQLRQRGINVQPFAKTLAAPNS